MTKNEEKLIEYLISRGGAIHTERAEELTKVVRMERMVAVRPAWRSEYDELEKRLLSAREGIKALAAEFQLEERELNLLVRELRNNERK